MLLAELSAFPGTGNSENLTFHGDKMGGKDHCCVIHCTPGRMKARNSAERQSFGFSNKTNRKEEKERGGVGWGGQP